VNIQTILRIAHCQDRTAEDELFKCSPEHLNAGKESPLSYKPQQ